MSSGSVNEAVYYLGTEIVNYGRGILRAGAGVRMTSRSGLVVTLAVSVALVAACGSGAGPNQSGGANQSGGEASQPALEHVHGLGVNPADAMLYVASHHGVFRVDGKGGREQIAGRTQDFMGFSIVGPNHFLASGHPGPRDEDQPSNLGLIESTDAAQSWTPLSLSGEADFHGMEAKHGRVYGYDSQSGQVMISSDMRTWDRRAPLSIADLAVAPDQPDEIVATTEQGPARSIDGGRTFTRAPNTPILSLVDWPSPERLVGVAPNGVVYVSSDRGATWTRRGQVPGRPGAVTASGDTDVYIATENAIQHSSDNGATFTVFQQF